MRTETVLSAALCILTLACSCSAELRLSIAKDGSARMDVAASVPESIAARISSYRKPEDRKAPLFDPAAVRSGSGERGVAVESASSPDRNSFKGVLSSAGIESLLAANPGLSSTGLVRYAAGKDLYRLEFSINRENASLLPLLFPGLDPSLLEALSPPAFDGPPVTLAEYRSMLSSLFGSALLPAIDAGTIRISITVPGTIAEHGGGAVSGSTLTVTIQSVDALVLERPLRFFLSWKP